jgi:hypothetical protein
MGLRILKGLSHTKIWRGAMGWLHFFNKMNPHGKSCHLTLLLVNYVDDRKVPFCQQKGLPLMRSLN